MGEKTVIEFTHRLKSGRDIANMPGISYISKEKKIDYIELPSYERVIKDKNDFITMFNLFYLNNNPINGKGLYQKYDTRYLIQNPAGSYLSQKELDDVYGMDFERDAHPFYKKDGPIKAIDTIKFSITTHRGCYGECNFCSIAIHQGNTVRWRSEKSIIKEAANFTKYPDFKGHILDVGGPTANMYGFECQEKLTRGKCHNKRCLYPKICSNLRIDHNKQIKLLKALRRLPGIKKVSIASGLRYDMVLSDSRYGIKYIKEVVHNHVSGQMKIAPEHIEDNVLKKMGKTDVKFLLTFKNLFFKFTKEAGKKQFLTYYFIAAHPGCTEDDMKKLKSFTTHELKINPEQIQIFTPTPSTYSSLMYYTEIDPFNRKKIFVEKNIVKKERQKNIVTVRNYRI